MKFDTSGKLPRFEYVTSLRKRVHIAEIGVLELGIIHLDGTNELLAPRRLNKLGDMKPVKH